MKILVVLPDGLSWVENKILPSHVYRGTLIGVTKYATPSDLILLAPANHFGFEIYEQDAAESYLKDCNAALNVVNIPTLEQGYIDTLSNARLLRAYMRENFKNVSLSITLICYKLHARRARSAFESQGFKIVELVETQAEKLGESEKLPLRLFYYRYPFLHKIYEYFALKYQAVMIYFGNYKPDHR